MKWLELDEAWSTQDEAARLIADRECPDIVFAHHQTGGRGRFGRAWHSVRSESLTMSLVLHGAPDHPRPWLCGMWVAVATAQTIGCRVRWPNDLTSFGRKLGGILTEVRPDADGRRIPILGIGINVSQTVFAPEIAETATSMAAEGLRTDEPLVLAQAIVKNVMARPWPSDWTQIKDAWSDYDETAGKVYLAPGGQKVVATGIGSQGELLGSSEGLSVSVMAAEALFGGPED